MNKAKLAHEALAKWQLCISIGDFEAYVGINHSWLLSQYMIENPT
jgi:hypothetical protein